MKVVLLELFDFGHDANVVYVSTAVFAALYVVALGILYVVVPPNGASKNKKNNKEKGHKTKQEADDSGGASVSPLEGITFRERVRMTIRMVGPLHALLAGLPALEAILDVVLNHQDVDAPWPEVEQLKAVTAMSAGYMLADGLVNLYLGEGLMLFHHLLTLLTQVGFFANVYATRAPSPHFPAAVYLATELTAPFLHFEFLMRKFGVKPSWTLAGVLYTLNLGLVLVAWLLLRVGTFFTLFYKLFKSWEAHRMDAVLRGDLGGGALAQFSHIYFFGALLTILNVFWFFKILRMITTKAFGGRPSQKKKKKQT